MNRVEPALGSGHFTARPGDRNPGKHGQAARIEPALPTLAPRAAASGGPVAGFAEPSLRVPAREPRRSVAGPPLPSLATAVEATPPPSPGRGGAPRRGAGVSALFHAAVAALILWMMSHDAPAPPLLLVKGISLVMIGAGEGDAAPRPGEHAAQPIATPGAAPPAESLTAPQATEQQPEPEQAVAEEHRPEPRAKGAAPPPPQPVPIAQDLAAPPPPPPAPDDDTASNQPATVPPRVAPMTPPAQAMTEGEKSAMSEEPAPAERAAPPQATEKVPEPLASPAAPSPLPAPGAPRKEATPAAKPAPKGAAQQSATPREAPDANPPPAKRQAARSPPQPAISHPPPDPSPELQAAIAPLPPRDIPKLPPASKMINEPARSDASRLPPSPRVDEGPMAATSRLPPATTFKPGSPGDVQRSQAPGRMAGELGERGGTGQAQQAGGGGGATSRGHGGGASDAKISELQARIDRLLLVYNPDHPDVAVVQREIDELYAQRGPLTSQELAPARQRLAECWQRAGPALGLADKTLDLELGLDRDGSVREARIGGPEQRRALPQQSVLDFARGCGPLPLPPERYLLWRRIELRLGAG